MADDLHDRLRFYSRVGKIRYGTMASVMKYKGQSLCAKLEFPGLRQNIAPGPHLCSLNAVITNISVSEWCTKVGRF